MPRFLLAAVLAFVLAASALAAGVDPAKLVLRHSDVPAGFRLDRDQTGVRSNAREGANAPELPALFRRWGRITGYQVEFDRGAAGINTRADLYRTARGARDALAWYDREVRKTGMKGLRRVRVSFGAGGFAYSGPLPEPFALVVWRDGRVFSGLATTGVSMKETLALARKQQKRIAAALR